ncbi:MAG: SRPBCC domain-containing protein [Deferribacteres bacterium]|nr:SRPBCC domain-containing protein [candidate division KSB1 bacterium]MCB9503615.1 SRPBCC domain-containing protein [Deferribacteres bacterium]
MTDKIFENKRKIHASVKKIFNAFEDPALLAKWWGPEGFTNTFHIFEFKKEGIWSFIMHGPDGVNYKNESLFQEISKPNRIVIRHTCEPFFTLTVTIEDVEGGAVINWHQDFDSEKVARSIAHIVKPANEQNLDRLQALVTGSE